MREFWVNHSLHFYFFLSIEIRDRILNYTKKKSFEYVYECTSNDSIYNVKLSIEKWYHKKSN